MMKDQAMPPQQRAKIAVALTGNSHGVANRGMKRTPEERSRISAAQRAAKSRTSPSYTAVHKRLRKDRGTPSCCEHCGTATAKKFEWAFTGEGHESGGWSADLSQYIRLCTSCHIRFDHGKEVMSNVSLQADLLLKG